MPPFAPFVPPHAQQYNDTPSPPMTHIVIGDGSTTRHFSLYVVAYAALNIQDTLVTALVTFRIASPLDKATYDDVYPRHAHHTMTTDNWQYKVRSNNDKRARG